MPGLETLSVTVECSWPRPTEVGPAPRAEIRLTGQKDSHRGVLERYEKQHQNMDGDENWRNHSLS